MGSNSTSGAIAYGGYSATYTMGSACPMGEVDDTRTAGNKATGIDMRACASTPAYSTAMTTPSRSLSSA